MFDPLIELSPAVLAVVPIAIGLVQLLKNNFAERWTPLLALFIGFLLAVLAIGTLSLSTVIQGLALGLIAMGVFSGSKTIVR